MSARASIVFGLAIGLAIAIFGSIALAQSYGWGGMGGYGPGYGPCMMGGCGYGYGPGVMGGYGPGMMGYGGYGMMYGPGNGPGMMGPGWYSGQGNGPGMMGPGWYGGQGNLNLSTDDVKNYLERWIVAQGNPRLTVGNVKEKDADSIEADIVTNEGNALVQRFIVNCHTGFYQPSGS